jgi:hypothetical protein
VCVVTTSVTVNNLLESLMKNFFKTVAMFVVNYTTITAADTLVIGCRPWDDNIKGVDGLAESHFVDFQASGAPAAAPNFHHLDLNDDGNYGSDRFSDYAAKNQEKFQLIIIDWITYHHIRRGEAWVDFFNLLGAGGALIVPVTQCLMGVPASAGRAKPISEMLQKIGFKSSEIMTHDKIKGNNGLDLLLQERGGMLQTMLSFEPAIIVATK